MAKQDITSVEIPSMGPARSMSAANLAKFTSTLAAFFDGIGFTRTADTGQYNATSPTVPTTNMFYEVRAFGKPGGGSVTVRFDWNYAAGSGWGRMTVGTGSDGSGNVTGVLGAANLPMSTGSAVTSTSRGSLAGMSGEFVAFQLNGASSAICGFYIGWGADEDADGTVDDKILFFGGATGLFTPSTNSYAWDTVNNIATMQRNFAFLSPSNNSYYTIGPSVLNLPPVGPSLDPLKVQSFRCAASSGLYFRILPHVLIANGTTDILAYNNLEAKNLYATKKNFRNFNFSGVSSGYATCVLWED